MENQMNPEMSPSPVHNVHVGMIVGAVTLLVVGGVIGYMMGRGGSKPVVTATLMPTISTSPEASDWKTYTDTKNGFSFQYPQELPTTFLRTQTWPPTVAITTGNFSDFPCDSSIKLNGGGTPMARETTTNPIFCVQSRDDGAAGTTYTSYVYTTSSQGKLISFSFVIGYPQCGNYDDSQKTACEKERATFNLDTLMTRIFSTFKFTK